jgi:hypothetical protein
MHELTARRNVMSEEGMWNDLRRLIDELELKMHLASMEVRERWERIQPALAKLEQAFERGGDRAAKILSGEVEAVGKSLKEMRDELSDAIDNKGATPP